MRQPNRTQQGPDEGPNQERRNTQQQGKSGDRSVSEGNKRKTRAKKEQKRRGDDKRKDREAIDRMRSRCIREVVEREEEREKERKEVMQELKQACVTLWTGHQRYHCATDTPASERIDAIEMSRRKCKPASRTPNASRCSSCGKTLASARRISSDVVTTDEARGFWR